jgi:uncharacterized membrane protein YagU involved in acid resistance
VITCKRNSKAKLFDFTINFNSDNARVSFFVVNESVNNFGHSFVIVAHLRFLKVFGFLFCLNARRFSSASAERLR